MTEHTRAHTHTHTHVSIMTTTLDLVLPSYFDISVIVHIYTHTVMAQMNFLNKRASNILKEISFESRELTYRNKI